MDTMVRILNELPHYCQDCPYISLRVCERLGSGALAYSCNHIGMCSRIYSIAKRESLRKHCEQTCNRFIKVPTSGTYEEHRLVLDLLNQTEWIPTSERFPEEDGEYLATIYDMDEDHEYMDIAEFEDGKWQYKNFIKVLAWMPLPKPYKESE